MVIALERITIPDMRGAFYQWRLSNGRCIRAQRADWIALGGTNEMSSIPIAGDEFEEPDDVEFGRMLR